MNIVISHAVLTCTRQALSDAISVIRQLDGRAQGLQNDLQLCSDMLYEAYAEATNRHHVESGRAAAELEADLQRNAHFERVAEDIERHARPHSTCKLIELLKQVDLHIKVTARIPE